MIDFKNYITMGLKKFTRIDMWILMSIVDVMSYVVLYSLMMAVLIFGCVVVDSLSEIAESDYKKISTALESDSVHETIKKQIREISISGVVSGKGYLKIRKLLNDSSKEKFEFLELAKIDDQ